MTQTNRIGTLSFLAVLTMALAHAHAGSLIDYSEDFSTVGSESAFTPFNANTGSSTVAYNVADEAVDVELTDSDRSGPFTRGPGKTALPADMTFTQSVDIYIDPSAETSGTDTIWTLEVLLQKDDASTKAGEFDFFGKWVQDDGEGDPDFEDLDNDNDTTDWIYKVGRNNDSKSAPHVVDDAGWFTFTTEWISDGTSLTNNNTISDENGNLVFSGTSTGGNLMFNASGYTSNYMWLYGRDETSTSLKLDNLRYEAVPEPASLALFGVGGLALFARRRRQS